MVELNTSHPNYDLSLEVLSMLPVAPAFIYARDLAEDLGLTSWLALKPAFDKMPFGVGAVHVKLRNRAGLRRCFLQRNCSEHAQKLGREYLQRVYGE